MKKVIVIGSGGSGKSTLAKRLGNILQIEVFHLDKLYWQPNWKKTAKDEWQNVVRELLARDSWILDGNFGGTLEMRLQACDTVIFLDLPPLVCLYRILKRRFKYRNTNRPDMTEGCNEKVDFEFLSWILNYRRKNKPEVEKKLEIFACGKRIIRLKSKQDVEKFFADF